MTMKVVKQYIRKAMDLAVQGPIFFCTRYISTGKYTTIGQKLIAPATPTIWLKYGNRMANPVVNPTYAVRRHSLIRFSLKTGNCFNSLCTNLLFGYFFANTFSMLAYRG